MTPLAWLACAAAILLVPSAPVLPARLRRLADHGRLGGGMGLARRYRPDGFDGPAVVALAAAGAGAVAALWGVALAVAAAVVVATAGQVLRVSLTRRRTARARDELITALRLLTAELAAGSRPVAALRAAADTTPTYGDDLLALAVVVDSGGELPTPGPAPPVDRLAHAWRVSEVSGAPIAEVVSRLVADLDDARERDRQVASALAGPRSSAALLAGLPVVGLALGAAMGADPLSVLVSTGPGRVVGALGAVLDALGVAWTMRIAAGAERA